ncbi:MAG: Phenol regulator MopR [Candidatus Marinimicrobia bacterium]|nr:Phenol regulator MopR [Candidatus Neomarinimicrobiota bacterium]
MLGNPSEGTFFLDELASMHPSVQAKLLKAIEEKKIRGVKDLSIDIRVLAATSEPLERLIEEGKFREDLYYRLNVISIELPPLRERGDDILLLAEHFIEQFNKEFKFRVSGLSEEAEDMLMLHDWPGNVRELRNVIERAVLLKKSGEIDTHHLTLIPSSLDVSKSPQNLEHRVYIPEGGIDFEQLEKKYLETALKRTQGKKSKAAKLLGMSRSTFRYRLKKFFGEDENTLEL